MTLPCCVHAVCHCLPQVFPGCRPQLDAVTDNYEMWREEEEREKAAEGAVGGVGRAVTIKRAAGSTGSPRATSVAHSPLSAKSSR
jgi:hypothetical protein